MIRIPMAVLICLLLTSPLSSQESGAWTELPLPVPGKGTLLFDLDQQNTPWICLEMELYYWNGTQFVPPKDNQNLKIDYFSGGKDRPLIAATPLRGDGQCELYLLTEGRAIHLTKFMTQGYRTNEDWRRVFVTQAGNILNINRDSIDFFDHVEWKRFELDQELELKYVKPIEALEQVFILAKNRLYSINDSKRLQAKELIEDLSPRDIMDLFLFARWKGHILVTKGIGGELLRGVDLKTGHMVDMGGINRALKSLPKRPGVSGVQDLVSLPGGYFGVVFSNRFYTVTPDNVVSNAWTLNNRHWWGSRAGRYQNLVCQDSSNGIWMGLPEGIFYYKRDTQRLINWKDHVYIKECVSIREDNLNRIYAASNEKLYRYDPSKKEKPESDQKVPWQEYSVASHFSFFRDNKGQVWTCLKKHPEEVSCWDGSQWRHVKVPFNTAKIMLGFGDIQDNVYFITHGKSYLMTQDGEVITGKLEDLLVKAVENGVDKFISSSPYFTCVVMDHNKICYLNMRAYPSPFRQYDGEEWSNVKMGFPAGHFGQYKSHPPFFISPVKGLLKWNKDGFYTKGQLDKGFIHNGGIYPEYEGIDQILIRSRKGPAYAIPIKKEKEMVWKEVSMLHPLSPGCKNSYWRISLSRPKIQMPQWKYNRKKLNARSSIAKVSGKGLILCDFSKTPLFARTGYIEQILEDRAGNIWYDARIMGNKNEPGVFMQRPEGSK